MDPRTAPRRLRSLPTWLLAQGAAQGHRIVGERLSSADIAHRYHFSLLAALDESGPTSQADLGRRIGLDRSDVTAAIADLERGGYIERAPDPRDRRRNLVHLTDSGRRHLDTLDTLIRTAQAELLAPLTGEEQRHLIRLLRAIVDHHT
ncbi:MarR family transcriptional regulator [Nocardia otitidiscaviarum]|uniref:MarR family winged helix-turn-helix transcriptional regulator n=1 Tax=Nocardia otitidiscaviarum TaxID=1823 RepID=UPI0009DE079C|nr:MarR family transcriptional regulator [Nocardia otitidiscaviarum]MBF6132962.1 MarR family transcriptional regulator [Nocardia otitidiscaviarum]MBF6486357.1 MarR family transcriptional regulator [Nocardia otitidiscaviarum]